MREKNFEEWFKKSTDKSPYLSQFRFATGDAPPVGVMVPLERLERLKKILTPGVTAVCDKG